MQNDGPRRKRRKTDQDEDATHIAITCKYSLSFFRTETNLNHVRICLKIPLA